MTLRPGAPLLALAVLSACATVRELPVAQPAAPLVDLSPFRRIWIAGFLTSENESLDVNVETVRLLRGRLNRRTPLRVVQAEPLLLRDESELANQERWKQLAEEHGGPLIVSGSLILNPARPVAVERPSGRGTSYLSRVGFVLEATFVFIDGQTGAAIASHRVPRETVYAPDARASTMSLYFQLMDRVMPVLWRALGV